MARHRARRRTGKDVLALAVRKDFNAAIVLESELITSFLYAVQNQGKQYKRSRESVRQVFDSLPRHKFPYAIRAVAGKIGQLLRGVYHRRLACSKGFQQVTLYWGESIVEVFILGSCMELRHIMAFAFIGQISERVKVLLGNSETTLK